MSNEELSGARALTGIVVVATILAEYCWLAV